MELMRRHGKDLEFVGCVISNNVMRIDDKETMAIMSARICRDTLKADCVLVNKSGMGHGQLDAVINSSHNFILHHERVGKLIGENANVSSLLNVDPWGPFDHTTAAAYQGHMNQLGDFFLTADPELKWA